MEDTQINLGLPSSAGIVHVVNILQARRKAEGVVVEARVQGTSAGWVTRGSNVDQGAYTVAGNAVGVGDSAVAAVSAGGPCALAVQGERCILVPAAKARVVPVDCPSDGGRCLVANAEEGTNMSTKIGTGYYRCKVRDRLITITESLWKSSKTTPRPRQLCSSHHCQPC